MIEVIPGIKISVNKAYLQFIDWTGETLLESKNMLESKNIKPIV